MCCAPNRVAAVTAILVTAISLQSMAAERRIELEHVGPQDAAPPRLVICAGAVSTPAAERQALVFVSPTAFNELCSLLKYSSAPASTLRVTGTFMVFARGCDASADPDKVVIGPQGFLRLVNSVSSYAAPDQAESVDAFKRVATIVRKANQIP